MINYLLLSHKSFFFKLFTTCYNKIVSQKCVKSNFFFQTNHTITVPNEILIKQRERQKVARKRKTTVQQQGPMWGQLWPREIKFPRGRAGSLVSFLILFPIFQYFSLLLFLSINPSFGAFLLSWVSCFSKVFDWLSSSHIIMNMPKI